MATKLIDRPGEYEVTIMETSWEKVGKPGDPTFKMFAKLRGQCHIDGELREMTASINFSATTLIKSGKNAGKSWFQVSLELMKRLGIAEFKEASDLDKLKETDVVFVVQKKTRGEGNDAKEFLEVSFVNPLKHKLDQNEAKDAWAAMMSTAGGAQVSTANVTDSNDPFAE